MNKCEKVQFCVLNGSVLSSGEAEHLRTCAECRSYADFVKRINSVSIAENEIPDTLDELISRSARTNLNHPLRKSRHIILRFAASTAAVFAVAAGVLFYQYNTTPSAGMTVIQESSFDDEVFTLAMDVGSGMDSFYESIDILI